MTIHFRRFLPGDLDAIQRLNERLHAAGLPHVVGAERVDVAEADLDTQPVALRMFVASDGDEIRGAVWLREQSFWCRDRSLRAGWMIYPVSESLADPQFAGVAGTLLFGLLREQPLLMALGMGGEAGPFTRLLAGARWESALVPFWFRLLRPGRVLRRLPRARDTLPRRLAADALAATGLANLAHGLASAVRRSVRGGPPASAESLREERFEGFADGVWKRCRDRYGLLATRDGRALDALYPPDFAPLTRLRVVRDGRDLGWVCTQGLGAAGTWLEPHFGDLRVGIITDALADPADAAAVLQAGAEQLVGEGVDLVVTHQSHPAWCAAARRCGFWKGPSNLAFSWSPDVAPLLVECGGYHLTRSDGDGPQAG